MKSLIGSVGLIGAGVLLGVGLFIGTSIGKAVLKLTASGSSEQQEQNKR